MRTIRTVQFAFMETSNFSLAASPTVAATAAINVTKVMVFFKTKNSSCKKAKQALSYFKADFSFFTFIFSFFYGLDERVISPHFFDKNMKIL